MLDVPSPWQRWLPALRSVQMGQYARPLSVEHQLQSSPPQTEDLHKSNCMYSHYNILLSMLINYTPDAVMCPEFSQSGACMAI